ncbi:MAG: AmmeMemoRadiSam system protein A [Syntrophomonadaceae bacterium]
MITFAALMPHPPIIVPEVGGERAQEASLTIRGMRAAARELVQTQPDTLVFLTPHGNVFSDCITCLTEPQLQGNLAAFGRPDVAFSRTNDLELIKAIGSLAAKHGIDMIGIDKNTSSRHNLNPSLDHGILVPLYYLEKAGLGDKPIAAISIGMLDNLQLYTLGKLIQEAAQSAGRRVAVVASGDMSHRLKDEGPYDFHPDGGRFDLMVKGLISRGDVEGLLDLPSRLVDNAGQCGYPSIIIMLGSLDGFELQTEVYSYEGPFGVGYMTAGLKPGPAAPSILDRLISLQAGAAEARRQNESPPVRWARQTLESYLLGGPAADLPQDMDKLAQRRAGVFVSLKKNGQLRGCIGTFQPVYENIAEEIKHNAIAAGLRDPRFSPVTAQELPGLVYSVDILTPPEPARREDLDPRRYGIIVRCGSRSGLLLPDLEGVDTVEQQLNIALQKAGISPGEKYSIQRFEVERYS